MSLPNYRNICLYFREHPVARKTAGYVVVMTVFSFTVLSSAFGSQFLHAFAAQVACVKGDTAYNVVAGDTLSQIAERNNTTIQALASHNGIANPDWIMSDQQICIPPQAQGIAMSVSMTPQQANTTSSTATHADISASDAQMAPVAMTDTTAAGIHGTYNPYPYAQCTYWASQRYFQVHGFFVPWTSNSDAWLWTTRAREYHWRVSSVPTVGSIMDLQPWVQGAFNLGHVAYVERVLPNGHVIASNMNWAGSGGHVVNVEFAPGRGVTFLSA